MADYKEEKPIIESAHPFIPRSTVQAYPEWRESVCQGLFGPEKLLERYYAQGWDAAACREMLLDSFSLREQPIVEKQPYQRKALGVVNVQKRVARAAYIAIAGLMVKNTTAEAREWLAKAQDYYSGVLDAKD